MKNNPLKEERKKYLLLEPLKIHVIDEKYFNNFVDFERFINKHITDLAYTLVSFYVIDEQHEENHISIRFSNDSDETKEQVQYIKQNAYDIATLNLHVKWPQTRLENKKELEKRQKVISNLSSYSTQQLLNAKRIGHYADDSDPLTSEILLAILDTREHVLRAAERKEIRQMKAKLQKTR